LLDLRHGPRAEDFAGNWFNNDPTISVGGHGLATTPQNTLTTCYEKQSNDKKGIFAFPKDISYCPNPEWPSAASSLLYYVRYGDMNGDYKADRAHAHHINQYSRLYDECNQVRQIYQQVGIYENEAANGVWLPGRPTPNSSAAGHIQKGMHTQAYRARVLQLIRNACQNPNACTATDGPAVRAALRYIRGELMAVRVFW
jgi:hypothetical protein